MNSNTAAFQPDSRLRGNGRKCASVLEPPIGANLGRVTHRQDWLMHRRILPERLNLAIARRCDVACGGCYTFFGRSEPDLAKFLSSVSVFIGLGLSDVTLSGGDPLTLLGLVGFLALLRSVGVRSIKLDTVGVGLVTQPQRAGTTLGDLIKSADYLGIPLDGWSDESALEFRRGRDRIFTETVALLDAFDAVGDVPKLIVNTVAHRGNVNVLDRLYQELVRHSCICQWNVFQYTPTDQAERGANARYAVSDDAFAIGRERFFAHLAAAHRPALPFVIDFRTTRSRLGQYLLVNSDGEAWLPDNSGRTMRLGSIFGREQEVLDDWSETVGALLDPPRVQDAMRRVVLPAKA